MSTGTEHASTVPSLAVRTLSKTFGKVRVLDGLDLSVAPGEIHSLVGSNGSGKSTFIKVLSGYHRADPGGEVRVAGDLLDLGSPQAAYDAGLRFVHQDLGLVGSASVEDNLCLNRGYRSRVGTIRSGANRREVRRALELVGLDIDPRAPIQRLGPATRSAVAVARALWSDEAVPARVLVLDEPTATLPADDVDRLLELVRRVARTGLGVVYVSHRLSEIFELAARVTVLRDGRQVHTGPVAELTRGDLVHHMVGTSLEETAAEVVESNHEAGDTVLEVTDLVAGRIDAVGLSVASGEVVGVAGITGSGREALLAALFGAEERGGSVSVEGQLIPSGDPCASIRRGVAYVPPDRTTSAAMVEMSARENFSIVDVGRFWRRGRLDRRQEEREAAEWFRTLDVRPPGRTELPLKAFSGGNQQKIVLAKWLRCDPRLVLLDEPTQGVDVGAKATIHHHVRATAERGAAVLVSSSDVDELAALCDRVLVMRDGRIGTTLSGADLTPGRLSRECVAVHPTQEPMNETVQQPSEV